MRAGRLRDRVTLQQKSVTRDAYGGEVVTWNTVATVYAELEPWHMKERLTLRRQNGEAVIGIRVRTPLDVSLAKRILFDGAGYDVIDIDISRKHLGELLITARADDATP